MADEKASESKQAVSLSLAAAKRIASAVQIVERSDRGTAAPAAKGPAGAARGQVAKVKTTVTARSGATYGAGTVTFQADGGSAYVDGADDVPVKNPYATSLAVGTWVTVVPASGGWTIFGADCP